MPPVVGAPLVAVVNAPAGAPVAVVETPMEVEEEDALLQRLFFKKYGRELPEKEKEKEKENDVDNIKFVIDLTDDTDEMEVATPVEVAVVKTEPIETAEAAEINTNKDVSTINTFANVNTVYNESGIRVSRRLELIELAKARKAINEFGKTLRKKELIPEKEAPPAASSNVIADTDSDMSDDRSVNPVGSVSNVNTIEMAERAIAESEAAIAATQKVIDEFDD